MGRAINWVYGIILLYIAAEALNWLNFVPKEFLPYAVLLMGVVIMATRIAPTNIPGYRVHTLASPVIFFRRWVFGAVLFIMGLATLVPWFQDTWIASSLLVVGTRSGSLILAAVAVIYFLSTFAQARMQQVTSI